MRHFLHSVVLAICLVGCSVDSSLTAPDDTLGSILRVVEPRQRAVQLVDYFEAARTDELPAIKLAYEEARPFVDNLAGSVLALWWTNQDPIAAYEEGLAAAWIEPDVWAATVVREWARLAPEAALRKVREVNQAGGDEGWTRTLVLALVRGWFDGDRDPRPLIDLTRTLPIGRPQKEVLDVLFYRTMEKRGWPSVIEIVEGLPDSADRNFKRDAFKRLATVLAAEEPLLAVEWIGRHVDGPYGEHLQRRVGRRWAHDDGQAALTWAMSLPEVEAKDAVVQEAFRGWNSADVDAAARWIDAQESVPRLEGPLRMSILGRAERRGPALAMARVEALPESAFRARLVEDVARIWLRKDAAAAEAWLARQELSSEAERAIRAPQRNNMRPAFGVPARRGPSD